MPHRHTAQGYPPPDCSRPLHILHCNPVFRMHLRQIQYCQEEPFQGLHRKVDEICRISGTNKPRHRKTVFIIKMPHSPVKPGCPLLQNLPFSFDFLFLPFLFLSDMMISFGVSYFRFYYKGIWMSMIVDPNFHALFKVVKKKYLTPPRFCSKIHKAG